MAIDFLAPPELGHTHVENGHRYTLVNVFPYTRRTDGAASHILLWEGTCAACGGPAMVQSGLVSKGLGRRCHACRESGRKAPLSREAKLARRAGGRKGRKTAKERAAKRKAWNYDKLFD